jgi:hypothetical protein
MNPTTVAADLAKSVFQLAVAHEHRGLVETPAPHGQALNRAAESTHPPNWSELTVGAVPKRKPQV